MGVNILNFLKLPGIVLGKTPATESDQLYIT